MGPPSRFGILFKIHAGRLGWVYDRAGAGHKVRGTRKTLSSGFLPEPSSPIPPEAGHALMTEVDGYIGVQRLCILHRQNLNGLKKPTVFDL
jgi:hypothetical protein